MRESLHRRSSQTKFPHKLRSGNQQSSNLLPLWNRPDSNQTLIMAKGYTCFHCSMLVFYLVSSQVLYSIQPSLKGPSAAKNPSGQQPKVVLSHGSTYNSTIKSRPTSTLVYLFWLAPFWENWQVNLFLGWIPALTICNGSVRIPTIGCFITITRSISTAIRLPASSSEFGIGFTRIFISTPFLSKDPPVVVILTLIRLARCNLNHEYTD